MTKKKSDEAFRAEAMERKRIGLQEKYAPLIAARFIKYPLAYYSDSQARSILINEYNLREADAMLVLPRVGRLLMIELQRLNPDYRKMKGIQLGSPPKVGVSE